MYSVEHYQRAREMLAEGMTDRRVATEVGVSRRTVARWRLAERPPGTTRRRTRKVELWSPEPSRDYAYALGMYLGDGHIAGARHPFLRFSLDRAYPGVIAEARAALSTLFHPAATHLYSRPASACMIVQLSSPWLLQAFPQHGPGKKHEREIRLADWQERITLEHPRALLRGLIHSDGCRTINRFETRLPSGRLAAYAYPRYFFTNLSADIRRIFCRHCELLGIRWSQSNARNISVSHRDSVALLDSFIGPKH